MHCYTQCPQPCSRPPLTHASAEDSWTFPAKSGSVSCGVTAPFSWALVHTRFSLCPPRVYFPVLCKFWQLYGGVNGEVLQEGLCHDQDCCTQSQPTPPQEMLKHSSGSVSVGSLGPGAQGSVCALQESVSPVLCKFWQLYGGVNGNLLQEGLCHTQVCCTQSPCPCGSPLLTRTSTGDTQTQFCLSLCVTEYIL